MNDAITRRTALAGALALPALLPAIARGAAGDSVAAPAGRYRGLIEAGIQVFRGIRYGQDTRRARFRAPAAPAPTRETLDATAFAPSCPQANDEYRPASEDCLFLNIWTPGADVRARRPVMLYIHGGAYTTGSVVDPRVDGRVLAADADVVVVTVNHRLNAFGYLYLARLDPRFADSGNAGQLDLILALRWIRANIASFGGDPACVTVFGQSGGGAKIATMMAMPAAQGLFHRAITMSGQQVTASGPLNAGRRTAAFLERIGVAPDNPEPLLTMPTERLVEGLGADDPILGGSVYFGPVLDMKWLVRHPFWPDAHPQSNAIPMILGNTRDETRAFIDPAGPKLRGLDWTNLARRIAPELRTDLLPEWIVAQYRTHFPDWPAERIFYAATTAGRSWPGQVIEADARARAGAKATWVYQLDYQSPVRPERGAPHGADIWLAFGTLDAPGSLTGTGAAARRLSGQVRGSFAAFARTGDPNHAGLPHWPRYALPDRPTMLFDAESRAASDPRRWERELFARVPYIQPGS